MPSAPPAAEQLAALPDDVWAGMVVHLRRVLSDLPDDQHTPRTRQLATVPTRRLVSGRSRRDVERRLAAGGPMWVQLRERVLGDHDLAAALGEALAGVREEPAREGLDEAVLPAATDGPDPREVQRLRSRLRRTREERDRARRRAEGETARADREARARQDLERRVQDLDARVDDLQESLRSATREREAAVDRERRRTRAEVEDLQERLRVLRREREERRRRQRAQDEAEDARQRQPAATSPPVAPPRLVPGRPSRLPDQVRAGTTEAVDLLLHAGRLVLVDGYNVTRTHRSDLDLESQRRWLVNLLAGATAARGIDPTVIFDGHGTAGAASSRRERGVWVQFTAEGITADDDLVFQAEATDPGTPLVVVTDDRQLRDRLASLRVDLVPTGALVGALR